MLRADLAKEELVNELESLRQRVAELEQFQPKYQTDKKLLQFEDEQKYKAVFESVNDIILLIDKQGKIIDVNERLKEIGGYERAELIGKNIRSLAGVVTPKSMAKIIGSFLKRVADVHTSPYEVEMFKKNGGLVIFEVSARPLRKDGKVIGDLAILRDITERKRLDEALKASEQNFRNSLDNSLLGTRIVDVQGQSLYANQALLDIFGYENFDELKVSPPQEHFTPEAYSGFALRREKRMRGELIQEKVEIDIIRKDGAIRHLQIFNKDILWNGKKELQIYYNDITEFKQSEIALKASEQNFRNSMDSSSMGIRIMGDCDCTLYANQALLDMFGYKNIEELRASPPQEHYTPESYAAFVQRHAQFLRGESLPDQLEFDIIRKDGAIRHLQLSSKEVCWNGGQEHQFVYNDITERVQMEKALCESEEKYRLIVENSNDIIFTLNAQGEFTYLSPSVKKVLGYNPDDLLGLPFRSLIHPDDVHVIDDAQKSKRAEGSQTTVEEYRFRNASGEWRRLLSTGVPMREQNKNMFNFIGIARDITVQKKIEADLKASEQNFRNSIDCSSMGIRIMGDHDHILYANQSLLDMFGYENIEELRASPPQEHYTPESYAAFVQRHAQFLRGESLPDQLEFDIIRKDGAIRHLQLSSMKVLWNGKEQSQTLYNDITAQKQAQERIEQAAQEWKTTFDSISDIIMIHDKDNRIIRVNKAAADMLKTTPKELIGKFCHEVIHGTKEPPANCPHMQTLKTGKSTAVENFNIELGTYFQEFASPVFNDKGEIAGSVIVSRDVTQQKRMEEQLIMTDRLASIGELSSGIAHELNNPLTSVIGFSELLLEDEVPANMKENLDTIHSEAQRAASIVKNLLTFGRKHAPVKQLSQVNTALENVLKMRSYEEKVNNIEIEKQLIDNLPQIMIDNFQMQQVFLNIIVNAEFAMLEKHKKGKLVVKTEEVDGFIRITFADDGPGISTENLKHIFDPFFTTKEVGKGTGLGLSICHGIVTEHHGKIYAKSENGQGSIFVVELPVIG